MELLWLSLGLILAIIVERRLYKPNRLLTLDYSLQLSKKKVTVGDQIELQETITNRGWYPFSAITSTIEIPVELAVQEDHFEEYKEYQLIQKKISLLWFQKATRRYTLKTIKRGAYTIKTEHLRYSDALLLDEHTINPKAEAQLLVYPKLVDIEQIISSPLQLFGDHFVQRWMNEDYFYPSGIRDYQAGDQLRFVDWKNSAKYQELKTRTYDYTNSNQLHLVLNLQTSPIGEEADSDLAEDVIRVGATLLEAASQEGYTLGLYANGGCIGYLVQSLAIAPQADQEADQHLEYLARLKGFHNHSFDLFLQRNFEKMEKQTEMIIVTGYVDEAIYQSLLSLHHTIESLKVVTLGSIDPKFTEGLRIVPARLNRRREHG